MSKRRTTKLILSLLIILSGNIFWYSFLQSIGASHILSSSTLIVAVSLIIPIFFFSMYLSFLPFLSIFIERKLVLFFCILLSMFDYSLLIDNGYLGVIGEIIISCSIYFFLIHLHQIHVIDKYKTSIVGQLSIAFSNASLIISLVVGYNFYNVYAHALSSQTLLMTNKVAAKALMPIVKVYLDDLQVKNIYESVKDYSTRRAQETKKTTDEIKNQLSATLGVPVSDANTLKDVVKKSLDTSLFKFTSLYRSQIPILISFGLGIITQTLISASTFISNVVIVILLRLFLFLKVIRYQKEKIVVDILVPK